MIVLIDNYDSFTWNLVQYLWGEGCEVRVVRNDELDIAVFDAYGWPSDLTDEQILERLVALNTERAEEEKRGHIRWLRPEYQNPAGQQAVAQVLDLGEAAEVVSATVTAPKPWPKTMPEQVALIRGALAGAATVSAKALAKLYKGVGPEKVEEVLVTLAALGQARMLEDGRFVGVRAA